MQGFDEPVEQIVTHISNLFLTPTHVFKLKRALCLPFVDQSSIEKRLALCRNEVKLNQRLAPQVYLGVAPLLPADETPRESAQVPRFCIGDIDTTPDNAVDYAVVMKRLREPLLSDLLVNNNAKKSDLIEMVSFLFSCFSLSLLSSILKLKY